MAGKTVEFRSNGGKTAGYLAVPKSDKGPGVLVIHDSSSSGVIPAYFAGKNRRLEASNTASSSMYSRSSTSRLGK